MNSPSLPRSPVRVGGYSNPRVRRQCHSAARCTDQCTACANRQTGDRIHRRYQHAVWVGRGFDRLTVKNWYVEIYPHEPARDDVTLPATQVYVANADFAALHNRCTTCPAIAKRGQNSPSLPLPRSVWRLHATRVYVNQALPIIRRKASNVRPVRHSPNGGGIHRRYHGLPFGLTCHRPNYGGASKSPHTPARMPNVGYGWYVGYSTGRIPSRFHAKRNRLAA